MKKCEEFELAISAYVDGELARHERETLFVHLASCDRCDRFLHDVIHIRVEAARESIIPGPDYVAPSFVPSESKKVFRYSPDAPSVAPTAKPRNLSSSIRTLALAILIIVIACVVFSTTISFGARGESEIQLPQESAAR